MWGFLIGLIVGSLIGVILAVIVCSAPDFEEEDKNNEDKRGGIL